MPNSRTGTSAAERGESGGRWVTARIGSRGYRVDVETGTHTFIVDEPLTAGGTDLGATPYDYLLGALSGCMAITLRMYADRKGWPLEEVQVRLRTTRAHATDCESCETEAVGIMTVERDIEFSGSLSDEQRERLLRIAGRCPVKQTLERGIRMGGEPRQ